MRKCAVISVLLLVLSGCQYFDRKAGLVKVAQIGDRILYERDLAGLVPRGMSSEDSLLMVNQYINTWAVDQLLLVQAQKQLSKSESDVSIEVEQFRNNLLEYRYETMYIEQRLDTAVTSEECRTYYEEHPQAFISQVPVVKARVIKIVPTSVDYPAIRKLVTSDDGEELEKLEELCSISAEFYNTFGHEWTGMDRVAQMMDVNLDDCCRDAAAGALREIERPAANYLMYIEDMVAPGQITPLEFNLERIREIILSHRKQELLSTLKQELLDDAVAGNKLKIF